MRLRRVSLYTHRPPALERQPLSVLQRLRKNLSLKLTIVQLSCHSWLVSFTKGIAAYSRACTVTAHSARTARTSPGELRADYGSLVTTYNVLTLLLKLLITVITRRIMRNGVHTGASLLQFIIESPVMQLSVHDEGNREVMCALSALAELFSRARAHRRAQPFAEPEENR